MNDHVYFALKIISWERLLCGHEINFWNPWATSSPNRSGLGTLSFSSVHMTTYNDTDDHLLDPSFISDFNE